MLFLAGARGERRCVPFLRIAKGSFAFDSPTVLGATEDVGVSIGRQTLVEACVSFFLLLDYGVFCSCRSP